MKSDSCKSNPNHVVRWFEMQFKYDLHRCVFSPDALLAQIGYQSVFCVTSWILGAWMEGLNWKEGFCMATEPDKCPAVHYKICTPPLIWNAPSSHCFLYLAKPLAAKWSPSCTEHCNVYVHQSVPSPSLSGAAEFSTATWRRKCFDSKIHLVSTFFKLSYIFI